MPINVKYWGKHQKFNSRRVAFCDRCISEISKDNIKNKKCSTCDSKILFFDSNAEYTRYRELRLFEAYGEIKNLELQPKFPIVINKILVTTYYADFQYFDKNDKKIVEDVKGVITPVYRIKKKLVKALYDIDILET